MSVCSRAAWSVCLVMTIAASIAATGAEFAAVPKAMTFEMERASGGKIRLGEFSGRVVLVKVWASWCEQCQAAYPQLAALTSELGPKGLEVVAVNVDTDRRKAQAFIAARPSPMIVTFDPRGRLLQMFEAAAVPASFVLDRAGRVRFRHLGYTDETLRAYRREITELLAEPLH
jgi:thiol-disulfide isomerase/thioredoxin